MVEFKPGMKKEELLAIAAANGITADDSMTKTQIIAESAAGGEGGGDTTHGEKPAERPGEGEEDTGGSGTGDGGGEQPAEDYDTFVYCGPSIPRGRLKENAVFRGTLADVLNYLADVVEDYPQIPRLIVPTNRLAVFAVKVKTPGNIAHKYYSDIASAIRKGKEV